MVARAAMEKLEGQLRDIPVRLQRLKKSGMRKLSRTDADSRFLPDRRGFTLGYTATLAVSDDHLIVAQQISRERQRVAGADGRQGAMPSAGYGTCV